MTMTGQPEQPVDLEEIVRALKIAATMTEEEAHQILERGEQAHAIWPPVARAARFRRDEEHRVRLRALEKVLEDDWCGGPDGQWRQCVDKGTGEQA
jgi:hypothetical protein